MCSNVVRLERMCSCGRRIYNCYPSCTYFNCGIADLRPPGKLYASARPAPKLTYGMHRLRGQGGDGISIIVVGVFARRAPGGM